MAAPTFTAWEEQKRERDADQINIGYSGENWTFISMIALNQMLRRNFISATGRISGITYENTDGLPDFWAGLIT